MKKSFWLKTSRKYLLGIIFLNFYSSVISAESVPSFYYFPNLSSFFSNSESNPEEDVISEEEESKEPIEDKSNENIINKEKSNSIDSENDFNWNIIYGCLGAIALTVSYKSFKGRDNNLVKSKKDIYIKEPSSLPNENQIKSIELNHKDGIFDSKNNSIKQENITLEHKKITNNNPPISPKSTFASNEYQIEQKNTINYPSLKNRSIPTHTHDYTNSKLEGQVVSGLHPSAPNFSIASAATIIDESEKQKIANKLNFCNPNIGVFNGNLGKAKEKQGDMLPPHFIDQRNITENEKANNEKEKDKVKRKFLDSEWVVKLKGIGSKISKKLSSKKSESNNAYEEEKDVELGVLSNV